MRPDVLALALLIRLSATEAPLCASLKTAIFLALPLLLFITASNQTLLNGRFPFLQ
jgi:hypothetical protein